MTIREVRCNIVASSGNIDNVHTYERRADGRNYHSKADLKQSEDASLRILKENITVFTVVSGSGKPNIVFYIIANLKGR